MSLAVKSRLACLISGAVVAALLVVGQADGPGGDSSRAARTSTPADDASAVYAADPVRVRSSYRVAASARVSTIDTGRTFTIVGSVITKPRRGKAKPRPVMLAEKSRGKWRVIARKRSSRVGAYTFKVRSGSVAKTRSFRVQATRYNGLRAVATRPLTVRVVKPIPVPTPQPPAPPTPVPTVPPAVPETPTDFDPAEDLPAGYVGLGTATDWAYLFAGGARWNPCRTIRWAYNPGAQGYDALPDVKRAFARISGISGLKFKYVGDTTWRFSGNISDPAFPATVFDIGVGWSDATLLPTLAGNVVGYGGGRGFGVLTANTDVKYRMDRGYLILDNGHVLPSGFTQPGWGSVMMHEILHSLGLGHASEDVQLMFSTLTSKNMNPAAGDITGMAKVGAASGCLS